MLLGMHAKVISNGPCTNWWDRLTMYFLCPKMLHKARLFYHMFGQPSASVRAAVVFQAARCNLSYCKGPDYQKYKSLVGLPFLDRGTTKHAMQPVSHVRICFPKVLYYTQIYVG